MKKAESGIKKGGRMEGGRGNGKPSLHPSYFGLPFFIRPIR